MVIAFVLVLALAGAIGGKLVGDRAYGNGRAAGFAQAVGLRARPPDAVAHVSAQYGL
jgi:hypothetical protein